MISDCGKCCFWMTVVPICDNQFDLIIRDDRKGPHFISIQMPQFD